MSQEIGATARLNIGVLVRVRPSIRSPYSGRTGTITEIHPASANWVYFVRFDDGLGFSYGPHEIQLIQPHAGNTAAA